MSTNGPVTVRPLATRPLTTRAALLAAAAVLLASACGLSEDGRPELLSAENVPYNLLDAELPPTTTSPPSAASTTVTVFFISQGDDGTRLIPTEREVRDPESVADRLRALLEQPPTSDEVDDGTTTAIPSETVLVEVNQTPDSTEVVIELSPDFYEGAQGQSQRAAYAQITCTATNVPGISRVRFLLQGEPIGALVADGTVKEGAVSCQADYLGLTIAGSATTTTTAPEPDPEAGTDDEGTPAPPAEG